jgi:hypothetical protein
VHLKEVARKFIEVRREVRAAQLRWSMRAGRVLPSATLCMWRMLHCDLSSAEAARFARRAVLGACCLTAAAQVGEPACYFLILIPDKQA